MGQVALGFRSLIVQCVVFFIMAAILAWVLGGNLWRSPMIETLPGVSLGQSTYCWRVRLEPTDDPGTNPLSFTLATSDPTLPVASVPEIMREVLPLKAIDDRVVVAGQDASSGSWILVDVSASGEASNRFVSGDRMGLLEEWTRRIAGSS